MRKKIRVSLKKIRAHRPHDPNNKMDRWSDRLKQAGITFYKSAFYEWPPSAKQYAELHCDSVPEDIIAEIYSLWMKNEVTVVDSPEEAIFRILCEVVACRPRLKGLNEYGAMYNAVAPEAWEAVDSNIKFTKISKKIAGRAVVHFAARLVYWLIATRSLIRRNYFECLSALGYSDKQHGAFRALVGIEDDARKNGQLGGIKKSEKSAPVCAEVLKLWESRRNKDEKKRAFATRVQKQVVEFAKSHGVAFAPSNAVRRIAEMI